MDAFNVVLFSYFSDYFMVQHQFDTKKTVFIIPENLASVFTYYLSASLGEKSNWNCTIDDNTQIVSFHLTSAEIEKVTDWILNFNSATRNQLGLAMPVFYLDEDKIRGTTVDVYCSMISQMITYILSKENSGRDRIANWAIDNFMTFYGQTIGEAIKAKNRSQK